MQRQLGFLFFFSSRRRHTRWNCDWSSDVCSSDPPPAARAWPDGPTSLVPAGAAAPSPSPATTLTPVPPGSAPRSPADPSVPMAVPPSAAAVPPSAAAVPASVPAAGRGAALAAAGPPASPACPAPALCAESGGPASRCADRLGRRRGAGADPPAPVCGPADGTGGTAGASAFAVPAAAAGSAGWSSAATAPESGRAASDSIVLAATCAIALLLADLDLAGPGFGVPACCPLRPGAC